MLILSVACAATEPGAPLSDTALAVALAPSAAVAAPSRALPPALAPTDPAWAAGLSYEVYVRSFQDSDGDGIGDLNGLTSRLDYLSSLGVDTLWLMPLFPSVGPAGYDTEDYDHIRTEYGTDEDLDALVDAAHARGMRVLLDLPLNHVARTHPWFVAAEADADHPDRALFVYADTQWDTVRWFPAQGGGYYYAFFGDTLPDLNWKSELLRARMLTVFDAWLDRADGYRLNAVPTLVETLAQGITHTDETHALLAELRARAEQLNPDVLLLAEASDEDVTDNAAYLGSASVPEAHRVIDFPRRAALLASLDAQTPDALLNVLLEQRDAGVLGRTSPYLQSHDLSRLPETIHDSRARRLLQVVELTLPGSPILYYGEELDLPDTPTATGQDYAQRGPMPWDDTPYAGFSTGPTWMPLDPRYLEGANVTAQEVDPGSALNLVRGLACVRAALGSAEWTPLESSLTNVLAYARSTEEGRVVVVANLAPTEAVGVHVELRAGLLDLTTRAAIDAGDGLEVDLLAYEYRIYAEEVAVGCRVPAQTVGMP